MAATGPVLQRPVLNQRLTKVLGTPFGNGNLVFDRDSLLSPVGNRVTIYDLVQQQSTTLPFETRRNIKRMCVSHSGRFLLLVDVEGQALLVNLPRRVVLHRFHLKRKVYDIKVRPLLPRCLDPSLACRCYFYCLYLCPSAAMPTHPSTACFCPCPMLTRLFPKTHSLTYSHQLTNPITPSFSPHPHP